MLIPSQVICGVLFRRPSLLGAHQAVAATWTVPNPSPCRFTKNPPHVARQRRISLVLERVAGSPNQDNGSRLGAYEASMLPINAVSRKANPRVRCPVKRVPSDAPSPPPPFMINVLSTTIPSSGCDVSSWESARARESMVWDRLVCSNIKFTQQWSVPVSCLFPRLRPHPIALPAAVSFFPLPAGGVSASKHGGRPLPRRRVLGGRRL